MNPTPHHEQLFHGLSEPSRLRILYALADERMNVGRIVEVTGLSQTNTSNHLACLLGCGLVQREREGRFVYYRLADDHVLTLLRVADQVVSESPHHLLECPHCGASS